MVLFNEEKERVAEPDVTVEPTQPVVAEDPMPKVIKTKYLLYHFLLLLHYWRTGLLREGGGAQRSNLT